jgi:hypothetical protein
LSSRDSSTSIAGDEKREAAKDVSAFANSAGGRILYGVAEGTLADGRVVATGLTPLQDGSVGDRLADVLTAAVHARPALAMAHVAVTGGVVLIVEVYRSEADLHMVTGYSESRFYKRGAKGNVPMTEPEIREAYAQVSTTRASLEQRLADVAEPEVALRSKTDESIVVVPWHTSQSFFDPRAVPAFIDDVSEALRDTDLWEYARQMDLEAEGYRVAIGRFDTMVTVEDSPIYIAALKSGVVHISYDKAMRWANEQQKSLTFWPAPAITRIVETMIIAEVLYDALGYRGLCRLRYVLRPQGPVAIYKDELFPSEPIASGPIDIRRDFRFAELGGQYGTVIGDVMDQIFHVRGDKVSPYFSPDGKFSEYGRKKVTRKGVLDHLA